MSLDDMKAAMEQAGNKLTESSGSSYNDLANQIITQHAVPGEQLVAHCCGILPKMRISRQYNWHSEDFIPMPIIVSTHRVYIGGVPGHPLQVHNRQDVNVEKYKEGWFKGLIGGKLILNVPKTSDGTGAGTQKLKFNLIKDKQEQQQNSALVVSTLQSQGVQTGV